MDTSQLQEKPSGPTYDVRSLSAFVEAYIPSASSPGYVHWISGFVEGTLSFLERASHTDREREFDWGQFEEFVYSLSIDAVRTVVDIASKVHECHGGMSFVFTLLQSRRGGDYRHQGIFDDLLSPAAIEMLDELWRAHLSSSVFAKSHWDQFRAEENNRQSSVPNLREHSRVELALYAADFLRLRTDVLDVEKSIYKDPSAVVWDMQYPFNTTVARLSKSNELLLDYPLGETQRPRDWEPLRSLVESPLFWSARVEYGLFRGASPWICAVADLLVEAVSHRCNDEVWLTNDVEKSMDGESTLSDAAKLLSS